MDSMDMHGAFGTTTMSNKGGSLLTPDDKMSMQDIVLGMSNILPSSNEENSITSSLKQLLSKLSGKEEELDINVIAGLCGTLNSMVQLSGLQKNTNDIQKLLTDTLEKFNNNQSSTDINKTLGDFNRQLELIDKNPKNRTPQFFSALLSFWYAEMTKVKYDLSVLYSPDLKDPVVDFNSPTVLVKLNRIMGRFETMHNLFSATMGKLLTAMSHVSRNVA